jgi:hypothetical protein
MGESYDPKELRSGRQELLARLCNPKPEDAVLPAEADGYLRHKPDEAEVREARERLPELDQSE